MRTLPALLSVLLLVPPTFAQAAGLRGAANEAAQVTRLGPPDERSAVRSIPVRSEIATSLG